MFLQQTRIYNDSQNVDALEQQSQAVTDYPFKNVYGHSCPSDSYEVLTTTCTDWHVGKDQIDVDTNLRQKPTTQNYYNRSQVFLTGTAPFKGRGGYDMNDSNNVRFAPLSRQTNVNSTLGETDLGPWRKEFVPDDDIPVEPFIKGGSSTRACVRNSRVTR